MAKYFDSKEEEVQRLVEEIFKFSEMISDISNLMALERVKASDSKIAANPEHPMTWDSYHSLQDIDAYLNYLEKSYPDLVVQKKLKPLKILPQTIFNR